MSDDPSKSLPPYVPDDPFTSIEERDHFAAVGKVANEWAWLELHIDFNTLTMLNLPEEEAFCLTAHIAGAGRKLDAYISACRLKGAKKINAELEQFAKDTASLGESRNRIIHDSWIVPPITLGHPSRFEITARKTLKKGARRMSTGKVLAAASHIAAHREKLKTLHAKVLAEVHTSPEKPPSTSP